MGKIQKLTALMRSAQITLPVIFVVLWLSITVFPSVATEKRLTPFKLQVNQHFYNFQENFLIAASPKLSNLISRTQPSRNSPKVVREYPVRSYWEGVFTGWGWFSQITY